MNKRWPAALAAVGVAWYASDSLRHRREQGDGYDLHGDALDVGSEEFLRACEELTGAAWTRGGDVQLLVNGDRIFPAYLETIREAQLTINCLTYVYWRGRSPTAPAKAWRSTSSSTPSAARRWSPTSSPRCVTAA
jgi:cardiolipin synthase A/B